MEFICNYNDYLSSLQRGNTLCAFDGEVSVLNVVLGKGDELPIGQFYVLDTIRDSETIALMKVEYTGDSLCILEGRFIENSLMDVANGFGIKKLDVAIRWWNLCYFRDGEGKVKHESYYDNFYLANESENKLLDLHKALAEWIEESFAGVEGLIYILGDLANCNPIIYQLQQRGLKVKTVSIANSENISEIDERMLSLREKLAIPYCDAGIVNVSFIAPDGIDKFPAECHRSYLITIPIDLTSINDNAIGSFSYKDILPSEEFCRDYSCCGHDYSYVEMDLFADLHGNTVLKTTNSK